MSNGYNPHDHRNPIRPTTNFEVFVNLIKTTFGVGVLGIPRAVAMTGYMVAPFLAFPAIIMLCYCIQILIKTMYKICILKEEPYIPYEKCIEYVVQEGPYGMRKSSKFWKILIQILLIIYPLGIGAAYTIFMAQSLNNVFPVLKEDQSSLYIYEAVLIIPLFLINCLPNLHNMAIVATLGNILTVLCVLGLMYCFFAEPPMYSGNHFEVGNPIDIMMFLGTILFAMEGISVLVSIEEHMKTPKYFLGFFGLFNMAMVLVVAFYIVVGVTGYLKYGDTAETSINMNLPQTWLAKAIKYTFIFCVYYSYPIQCYPIVTFVWEDNLMKKAPENRRLFYEYLFRFGITLANVGLAMSIPRLDLAISLVGGICTSLLGFFFPTFMEYCYMWIKNEGRLNFTMVKDVILMIISLIITINITTAVIIQDIKSYVDNEETKLFLPLNQ